MSAPPLRQSTQQQQQSLIDQQHGLALLYAEQLAQQVSKQQPSRSSLEPAKNQAAKRSHIDVEETPRQSTSKRPRLSISRFPPTQTVYVVKLDAGTFHVDETCTNVQMRAVLVSTLSQYHGNTQLCQNCRNRNNL